ncbi:MAG: flavoprotein, partial [Bacteroidota bacterium]
MKIGNSNKLVVAITGASGSIYARQLLQKLHLIQSQWDELAIVMTDNAKEVWETELKDNSYRDYDRYMVSNKDFSAAFASGSGNFGTMIIIPCSMGTLGRMASGTSADLITRAAD